MSKDTFKSIKAIIAGFVTVLILSVATDFILESVGVFPPQPQMPLPWMLALALIYRSIYTVAGCYITAALAPNRPMRHALMLGAIGLVFATLGAVANWSLSAGSEWYPIALIVLTLPCAWLGGKLHSIRTKKS